MADPKTPEAPGLQRNERVSVSQVDNRTGHKYFHVEIAIQVSESVRGCVMMKRRVRRP